MKKGWRWGWLLAADLLLAGCGGPESSAFREKADQLRAAALTEEVQWEIGSAPADEAGYAVFFSVCDGGSRAAVRHGTGETLDTAWETAVEQMEAALRKSGQAPAWVKAEVVCFSQEVTAAELSEALRGTRAGYLRYGLALDRTFQTALLEGELHGSAIYDYETGGLRLSALERTLQMRGESVGALPETYLAFQTFGWFCDEMGQVYPLDSSRFHTGRRRVEVLDHACAEEVVKSAADHLAGEIQADGTFTYGYSAASGQTLPGYNILRHAGTLWALAEQYQTAPTEDHLAAIRAARAYLQSRIMAEGDCAFVLEERSGEIKLGGCALAVIALSACADIFPEEDDTALCEQLGNGILSMMEESGAFWHVFNNDCTPKEAFRTVYYDGEAVFALCRLYGLTGEQRWLTAAQTAADRFLRENYTQYGDHWVSYAMNALTQYVTDRADYYVFALENAQVHLQKIAERETAGPTDLELLMETFLLYDRMREQGCEINGFDLEELLRVIADRAARQLDAFFFPETAMYMAQPETVLGAFMAREDAFRTRIDDTQHSMAGLLLYAQNYETLLAYGMAAGGAA